MKSPAHGQDDLEPRESRGDLPAPRAHYGILMTPTLVKLAPFPVRGIVRTLSQTQAVLEALGLETVAA